MTISTFAQQFGDPLPHYERAGHGYGCFNHGDYEKDKRDVCLWIGPLFVGMLRDQAEGILGKPIANVNMGKRLAYAYPLHGETRQHGDHLRGIDLCRRWPHRLHTSYRDTLERQLALLRTYSWFKPGRVKTRLGEPFQSAKSSELGTLVLAYEPWTFSFEVRARE
jgi:hypothetical protein